jgi:hypothetical protein
MKNLKDYILNENNFFKNLGVGQVTLIKKWIEENCEIRGNYTINDDMEIDVDGEVSIKGENIENFPDYIQFGDVKYGFYICGEPRGPKTTMAPINTLRGCPYSCGSFICSLLSIKSLEYCPHTVKFNFICSQNHYLESLEGAPRKVSSFNCSHSPKLKSFKGGPEKCPRYTCNSCPKVKSADGLPKHMYLFVTVDASNEFLNDFNEKCEKGIITVDHPMIPKKKTKKKK